MAGLRAPLFMGRALASHGFPEYERPKVALPLKAADQSGKRGCGRCRNPSAFFLSVWL